MEGGVFRLERFYYEEDFCIFILDVVFIFRFYLLGSVFLVYRELVS